MEQLQQGQQWRFLPYWLNSTTSPISSVGRSCSITPSHGASLVRSHSNSASSISSQGSAPDLPTASDHEDHDSWSTFCEDNGSDDHSMANSTDEAPKVDDQPDSNDPTIIVADSDDTES